MRRLCERPGCGQPVAVIYGLAPSGSEASMWVDHWSPDKVDDVTPPGARGVVCIKHSESLSAPNGWGFEDRRESIPRLFKPRDRGSLAAVPDPSAELTRPKRETTGSLKRPRATEIPRPSLFAELNEATVERVPEAVDEIVVDEIVVSEIVGDDSTELLIRQDADTRWAPHFDPDDDLDGMLDATGSMLRDAFRTRHNGRQER